MAEVSAATALIARARDSVNDAVVALNSVRDAKGVTLDQAITAVELAKSLKRFAAKL